MTAVALACQGAHEGLLSCGTTADSAKAHAEAPSKSDLQFVLHVLLPCIHRTARS